MKHPRADLIAKWLEDTTQLIWYWDADEIEWVRTGPRNLADPEDEDRFEIGLKPTEPPQEMCTLAGVSFPVTTEKATVDGLMELAIDLADKYADQKHDMANSAFATSEAQAALRAYAERLAAQSAQAWILATEKLPEDGQEVLVYQACEKDRSLDSYETTIYSAGTELYAEYCAQPTHWQPLPAPPEVEE